MINELSVRLLARPGNSAQAKVGPLAAGQYVVYCSIPTHRELGMVATLVAH